MWANGAREESLNFLKHFSESLSHDVMQETNGQTPRASVSKTKIAELSKLVARCFYKQGEWQSAMSGGVRDISLDEVHLTNTRGPFIETTPRHLARVLPCDLLRPWVV